MKLGCCLNMLGDSSEPIGRRYMNLLYREGYDYMELPLAQIMELSEAGFEELLSQIQESGIPCECCNNFFPASVRLTGEEADPPKISEYVKEKGYDGRVSIEAYGKEPEKELEKAVFIRKYL